MDGLIVGWKESAVTAYATDGYGFISGSAPARITSVKSVWLRPIQPDVPFPQQRL